MVLTKKDFDMKKVLLVSLCAGVLALSPAAAAVSASEDCIVAREMAKPGKELKEVTFSVSMHCEKCVGKITENISFEKGVKDLKVSLDERTVRIKYDASKTSEEKLKSAIEALGYRVEKL